MNKHIELTTDKKSVNEGDFVEIVWKCSCCPNSLTLTIDSGYRKDTIDVADNGSTKIMFGPSKGKTHVILKAYLSGKVIEKEIKVSVKNRVKPKTDFRLQKEKLHAKWSVFCSQMRYWWMSQKKWQKILWISILLIWIFLLTSSIFTPEKKVIEVTDTIVACL